MYQTTTFARASENYGGGSDTIFGEEIVLKKLGGE
jgi:hypothetical protein